jgi:isopentenyl phosphate kinase
MPTDAQRWCILLIVLALPPATAHLIRRWRSANPVDVVVKLGGSALTNKASFETLHADNLRDCCENIAQSGKRVAVVHGAGSFGHFQAREHAVSKGSGDPKFSWRGFGLTRSSVCKLNGLVVDGLLAAGVAAVGVSPCDAFGATRGRGVVPRAARRRGVARVRELLGTGCVPVIHGDACLDEVQGASILSGDTLMTLLAEELRPKLVVFITDVPGVFDRPPDEPGATLVPRISVGAGRGPKIATSTALHDVTGGVAAKLESAIAIARAGTPVVVVEAGTAHARAALRGEVPDVCTLVERASESSS